MKARMLDFGSGFSTRCTMRLLKNTPRPPSYAPPPFTGKCQQIESAQRKEIMSLFIDGVKLSTLERLRQSVFNQAALIHAYNSRSRPQVGGIKYIPLLLYKCKRPSRQKPRSKLAAIKRPTARTDREIKKPPSNTTSHSA